MKTNSLKKRKSFALLCDLNANCCMVVPRKNMLCRCKVNQHDISVVDFCTLFFLEMNQTCWFTLNISSNTKLSYKHIHVFCYIISSVLMFDDYITNSISK